MRARNAMQTRPSNSFPQASLALWSSSSSGWVAGGWPNRTQGSTSISVMAHMGSQNMCLKMASGPAARSRLTNRPPSPGCVSGSASSWSTTGTIQSKRLVLFSE
ncbi:TPA_asm: UL31.5 [Human alphaherpesvirus 1]|nr:TPA_asm: UL31.5 [Human alphaherpesvirus 1]